MKGMVIGIVDVDVAWLWMSVGVHYLSLCVEEYRSPRTRAVLLPFQDTAATRAVSRPQPWGLAADLDMLGGWVQLQSLTLQVNCQS